MNNNSSSSGLKLSGAFSKYFDHTLLKADATQKDIRNLVEDALEWDFAAVCVNGCHVKFASEVMAELQTGSDDEAVGIAAVVGFPLGACTTETKLYEAQAAIKDGAGEIDMVINIGAAKEGRWDYVENEIKRLTELCHGSTAPSGKPVLIKVIFETCLLDEDEIERICGICGECGADFVKTSTGFAASGATAAHVSLMKKAAGPLVKVKASGGIRTLSDALAMIEAGADRLGCSASVQIMKEYSGSSDI